LSAEQVTGSRKLKMLSLRICLLLALAASIKTLPTVIEILKARDRIDGVIDANSRFNNNPEYPFIAGYVRLSFHDCVGDGGCDGCVDHSNPDNAGLFQYTESLDNVYDDLADTSIKDSMSRADFYMLAAYHSLARASEGTGETFDWSTMVFGRVDCGTSPDENAVNTFPSAMGDFPQAKTFFADQFGFDDKASVAILGAHTLGRCSEKNSGFEGKWVKGRRIADKRAKSDILDNEYYLQIRGNWTQVQLRENTFTDPDSPGKWQWQRPNSPDPNFDGQNIRTQPNMFLNVDMSILWDMDTDAVAIDANGKVDCQVVVLNNQCMVTKCCDESPVKSTFQSFVRSNSDWMVAFTDAFITMTHVRNTEIIASEWQSKLSTASSPP